MRDRLGMLAAYLDTRRLRLADRAAIEERQARRLRIVLDRARRRFPFYAGVTADLSSFPVMTKATMLENFAALNDRGLGLQECLDVAREAEARRDFTASLRGACVGLSSGTSGRQGVFLTTAAERRRWAGAMAAKALPEGIRHGARVALFLRAGGPLYESVGSGRIAFRYFDLADPPEAHLAPLTAFAPTILVAPPSALRWLATQRRAGRLRIAPGRVFSAAEVLDPHDEQEVAASFERRVDQIYQATEGFLGISCREGRLHLNEDLLVVERVPVGPDRFIPVITDLYRTTQAMIRMRLDDVLVAGPEGCLCGAATTVIERVEGRADDVLVLPFLAGGPGTGLFFADFVRGAVLGAPGVQDFRVAQTGLTTLELATLPADAAVHAAAALDARIRKAGLRPPVIISVPFTPPEPGVKLRRVRREAGVAAPARSR